jgi:hypothetical protein
MQFRDIRAAALVGILLLVAVPCTVIARHPKTGTLVGTALFSDPNDPVATGYAEHGWIELRYKGSIIRVQTDANGVYAKDLPCGRYTLEAVRSAGGDLLRLVPGRSLWFDIKAGKTTRFDIELVAAKLK